MRLGFEILTSASHIRSVAKFQYEHYVLEIYTSASRGTHARRALNLAFKFLTHGSRFKFAF